MQVCAWFFFFFLPWSNCFWMLSWSVLFPLTRYRPSVVRPANTNIFSSVTQKDSSFSNSSDGFHSCGIYAALHKKKKSVKMLNWNRWAKALCIKLSASEVFCNHTLRCFGFRLQTAQLACFKFQKNKKSVLFLTQLFPTCIYMLPRKHPMTIMSHLGFFLMNNFLIFGFLCMCYLWIDGRNGGCGVMLQQADPAAHNRIKSTKNEA